MKMRKFMKINKFYIGIFITLLVISLAFAGGYKYYNYTHPVTTVTDTITIVDTVTHTIIKDSISYVEKIDTLYWPRDTVFKDVDTAAILVDYYARYGYDRVYADSLISVDFYDIVSENKIVASTFLNYKILRPQTIITNTTTVNNYSSYLNLSFKTDLAVEYPELRAQMIGKNISYGIGYMPKQNALTINFGYNILKLK